MLACNQDYNARIEFYWAPFLLESNSDDPFKHRVTDRIIRNGSIDKHGEHWKEADILVFNTYIWWVEGVRILYVSQYPSSYIISIIDLYFL